MVNNRDALQRVLARVVPLQPGLYGCTSRLDPTRGSMAQKGWPTHKQMVGSILANETSEYPAQGLYYSPASLDAVVTETDPRSGKVTVKPLRTIQHFFSSRTLVMDVDIHRDDKPTPYPDLDAANAVVDGLTASYGIPAPNFRVDTGWGLHAYWILDAELNLDDWRDLSDRLVGAGTTAGIVWDSKVTRNPVTLLRAPYTTNRRRADDPKPCLPTHWDPVNIPFADMQAALYQFERAPAQDSNVVSLRPHNPHLAAIAAATPAAVRATLSADDNLAAAMEYEHVPSYVGSILPRCAALREAADTAGAVGSYPVWLGYLGVLAGADDGEDWAHKISSAYPSYSPEETDRQFRYARDKILSGGMGPTRCRSIREARKNDGLADVCAGCPHFTAKGGGSSPLVLGRTAAEPQQLPTAAIREYDNCPKHYRRLTGSGATCFQKLVPDKDGKEDWKVVFAGDITDVQIFEAPGEISVSATIHQADAVVHKIHYLHLDLVAASEGPAKCRVFFGRFNINFAQAQEAKNLAEIMMAYLDLLRQRREVELGDPPLFGWVRQGELEGYAHAGVLYRANGKVTDLHKRSRACAQYSCKGRQGAWKEAVERVTQQRPDMALGIATAFAGPLVEFTSTSGFTISLYSQGTGMGKSTAMRLAQSVWGSSEAMFSIDDTVNAMMDQLTTIRNLPAYWDEVKLRQDADQFISLLMRVSEGKGKKRLDTNMQQRDVTRWKTLMVVGTNISLTDTVRSGTQATDASEARVLEIQIGGPRHADTKRLHELSHEIENNSWGHEGVVYAQWLAAHRAEAQELTLAFRDAVEKMMGVTSSYDRFWLDGAAVLLAGAGIANDLGLASFDIRAMMQCLHDNWARVRKPDTLMVASSDFEAKALDQLLTFINAVRPRTLVTGQYATTMVKSVKVLMQPEDNRQGPLLAHWAGSVVRINEDAFKEYLKRLHQPSAPVLDHLRKAGATRLRAKLGQGTAWAYLVPQLCLEIDTAAAPFDRAFL